MNNKTNKQECSYAKDLLLEELQDGGFMKDDFELFLSKHDDCQEELKSFYEDWQNLGDSEVPAPSERMDAMFYKQLSEFQAEQTQAIKTGGEASKAKRINFNQFRKRIIQTGIAASIFLAGAITSFYMTNGNSDTGIIANMNQSKNTIVYAGYNENQSSVERLSDISEMKKAPKLNDKIIDALNKALINDPNINVRLSAIEAMLHYADNPKVRKNLIQAIPYQDSPIIQLTLAEVMIELEGNDSKEKWEELFDSDNIDPDVQSQLRETLEPVLKI